MSKWNASLVACLPPIFICACAGLVPGEGWGDALRESGDLIKALWKYQSIVTGNVFKNSQLTHRFPLVEAAVEGRRRGGGDRLGDVLLDDHRGWRRAFGEIA